MNCSFIYKKRTNKFVLKFIGRDSLFWEEISACAPVHTCYVMDVCDPVGAIILLPPMMGTSFMLVMLTRLIISKPKHQVTYPHKKASQDLTEN